MLEKFIKPLVIGDWQKIPLKKLFKELKTSAAGLSEKEAKKRSRLYDLNEIVKKKQVHPLVKFLSYLKNPLIIVLLVAAVLSSFTGSIKSALIIIVMVLMSVVLNFYQEYKSNKSAEKIAKKIAVRATVDRNGAKKEILTRFLVPGDVVYLSAGDIVPADGRLIEADDFFINESALTGESFPLEKSANDRGSNNTVSSGTNVVSGYGKFIVVQTGSNSEYGKIAKNLSAPEEITAFEIGIKKFGFLIVKVIIGIVLVIFLINALSHKDIIDSFIFSLAIAVGVTPELLPMIMSVSMTKGSLQMAKKGVLVKRLNAIPDFGSMDILCADKTGTLTEDKISLIKHLDIFGKDSSDVLELAYINSFHETGIKSILDKAILDYKDINIKHLKKIDEIPYDFMRKRSSVVYALKKNRLMVTKGVPEEIFKICDYYLHANKKTKITAAVLKKAQKLYDDLSRDGLRVLAVAKKDVADNRKIYPRSEEANMVLVGFVAFYDAPKKSAKETLDFMNRHGIEIKVLTGDSPLVAKKICTDLGMKIKGIISGEDIDIDKMDVETLAVKAMSATILARLSPSQKEAVISALRSKGLVVGYLGDGINDAPALKSADVGISVENAVDVAKESADIILMNKSLKELMDGVLEGRKTFGNTMKYLMIGLSSNFGNMLSMIGAAIYLPFFPMLPGQILLNNFLYDLSQLAIPTDNVDQEYLRKPKHWDMGFIRNFMYIFGPISSIFDLLTFYLLYSIFSLNVNTFRAGWFIESLLTQILVIFVIRTRLIPLIQSRPSKALVLSVASIITVGLAIACTSVGQIFGFSRLPFIVITVIFVFVFIYLFFVEMVKQFFYRFVNKMA